MSIAKQAAKLTYRRCLLIIFVIILAAHIKILALKFVRLMSKMNVSHIFAVSNDVNALNVWCHSHSRRQSNDFRSADFWVSFVIEECLYTSTYQQPQHILAVHWVHFDLFICSDCLQFLTVDFSSAISKSWSGFNNKENVEGETEIDRQK